MLHAQTARTAKWECRVLRTSGSASVIDLVSRPAATGLPVCSGFAPCSRDTTDVEWAQSDRFPGVSDTQNRTEVVDGGEQRRPARCRDRHRG